MKVGEDLPYHGLELSIGIVKGTIRHNVLDDVREHSVDLTFLGIRTEKMRIIYKPESFRDPCAQNSFSGSAVVLLDTHSEVTTGELHPDLSTVDVILE